MPMTDLEQDSAINALSQRLTDSLVLHTARIDNAQNDAWSARDHADIAIGRVYQTGIDAHTYTDAEIQKLRDELRGYINGIGGGIRDQVTTDVQDAIGPELAEIIRRGELAAAQAEEVARDLGFNLDDVRSVAEQILEAELPSQRELIQNEALRSINTKATLDLLLEGFGDPSFMTSLDRVRADLEDATAPLWRSDLRLPAGYWTAVADNNTFDKTPPPESWFVRNDPVLGEGLLVPAGTRAAVGPSRSLMFQRTNVYRIEVAFQVRALGTGGRARLRVGASSWLNPGTKAETSPELEVFTGTAVGETGTIITYVTADANRAASLGGRVLRLLTSSNARRVFFYAIQPEDGSQFFLDSIEIKDVTDAIEAMDYANTGLSDAGKLIADLQKDVDAALAAGVLGTNWDFEFDWRGWAANTDLAANPGEMNDVLTGSIVTGAGYTGGKAARFTGVAHLARVTPFPVLPDTHIKLTMRLMASAPAVVETVFTVYDLLDTKLREIVMDTRTISTSASFTQFTVTNNAVWGEGAAKVRMSLRARTAGVTLTADLFKAEDVTFEVLSARAVIARNEAVEAATKAGLSEANAVEAVSLAVEARNTADERATASNSSAQAASASADAADQSASAANGAKLAAETAQGEAALARDESVQASETAAGHAAEAKISEGLAVTAENEARTYKDQAVAARDVTVKAMGDAQSASVAATDSASLAVRLTGRGGGVLSERRCPPEWLDWNTGPQRIDNAATPGGLYAQGTRFRWNIGAATAAGVEITSDSARWVGGKTSKSYRIDIEFTLHSGSSEGAGVIFDFATATANNRQTVPLLPMAQDEIVPGEVTLASWEFTRPLAVAATDITFLRAYVMANAPGFFPPAGMKDITIHSIQIYPMTATEAAVQETKTAITDLQNNAAAGYMIKAQAGGEVSLLELLAADGSDGPVSIAKIEATDILLNGSVFAEHLHAESFSVAGLSIFGGTLKSDNFDEEAGIGWRITRDGTMNMQHAIIGTMELREGAASNHWSVDDSTLTVVVPSDADLVILTYARVSGELAGTNTGWYRLRMDGVEMDEQIYAFRDGYTSSVVIKTLSVPAGTYTFEFAYSGTLISNAYRIAILGRHR